MITRMITIHSLLKLNVGIGPLPGPGLAGESSWRALRRAESWNLPVPVTGPNGAPACMLISEEIVRKTIIIDEGEPVPSILNKFVLYLCKEPFTL
jgi:hypothetical protein